MDAIAVLGVLCALVVVSLAVAVWRLRSDVRALRRHVARADAATPAPAPAATESAAPSTAATSTAASSTTSVPVITRLSDHADDDLEVTRARVASVTLARPLIRVAAFSHGIRRALDDESRMRISWAIRQEFRRQRKMRRRRRAGRAPSRERHT